MPSLRTVSKVFTTCFNRIALLPQDGGVAASCMHEIPDVCSESTSSFRDWGRRPWFIVNAYRSFRLAALLCRLGRLPAGFPFFLAFGVPSRLHRAQLLFPSPWAGVPPRWRQRREHVKLGRFTKLVGVPPCESPASPRAAPDLKAIPSLLGPHCRLSGLNR